MSVKLVSLGRITELLPNKYVLGCENVENPANSYLVLTIAGANEQANLQHFYLGRNTDRPPNEGFLATYHLKFVLQVTDIVDSSGGRIVQYFPVPPDDPIVHDGKYPKWVRDDMLFTLKPTGEENTFQFFSNSRPNNVLDVRYFQDKTNNFIIVYPLKPANDPNQKFQTQNPLPP